MLPLHLLWTTGEATPSERRLLFARAKPAPVPKVENKEDPTGPETKQEKPKEEPKDDREKLKDLSAKDAAETVKKIVGGEQEKIEGYTESLNTAAWELGEAFPATLDASEWAEAGRILESLPAVQELNELTKFVNTKANEYRQRVDGFDTKSIDTAPTLARHGIEQKRERVFDLRFPKGKASIQYTLPGQSPQQLKLDESKNTSADWIISIENVDIGKLSVGDSKEDDVYTFTVNEKFTGQLSATINGSTETFWEGNNSSINTVSKEEQQELASASEEWNNNIQETRSYADSLINTLQGDSDAQSVTALAKGQELITLIGQNFDKLDATGLGTEEIAKHRGAFNEIISDLQNAIDQTTENITSGTEADIAAFEEQWEQWLGEGADVSADDAGNMRGLADDLTNYAEELKGNTALPEGYRAEKMQIITEKATQLTETALRREATPQLEEFKEQWPNYCAEIIIDVLSGREDAGSSVATKLNSMKAAKDLVSEKNNWPVGTDEEMFQLKYESILFLAEGAKDQSAHMRTVQKLFPEGVPDSFDEQSLNTTEGVATCLQGCNALDTAIVLLNALENAFTRDAEFESAYGEQVAEIAYKKEQYSTASDAMKKFQAHAVEKVGIDESNLADISDRFEASTAEGGEYQGDMQADLQALGKAEETMLSLQSTLSGSAEQLLGNKLQRVQGLQRRLSIANAQANADLSPPTPPGSPMEEAGEQLATMEALEEDINNAIDGFDTDNPQASVYFTGERVIAEDIATIKDAIEGIGTLLKGTMKKEQRDKLTSQKNGYREALSTLQNTIAPVLEEAESYKGEVEAINALGMYDYQIARIEETANQYDATGEYRAIDADLQALDAAMVAIAATDYVDGSPTDEKYQRLGNLHVRLKKIKESYVDGEILGDDDLQSAEKALDEIPDTITADNIADIKAALKGVHANLADDTDKAHAHNRLSGRLQAVQEKIDAFVEQANEDFGTKVEELEQRITETMQQFRSEISASNKEGTLHDYGGLIEADIAELKTHMQNGEALDYIDTSLWDETTYSSIPGWESELASAYESIETSKEDFSKLVENLESEFGSKPGFVIDANPMTGTISMSLCGRQMDTYQLAVDGSLVHTGEFGEVTHTSNAASTMQTNVSMDLLSLENLIHEELVTEVESAGLLDVPGVKEVITDDYHSVSIKHRYASYQKFNLLDGPNVDPVQNVGLLKEQISTTIRESCLSQLTQMIQAQLDVGLNTGIKEGKVRIDGETVVVENSEGQSMLTVSAEPNIQNPKSFTCFYSQKTESGYNTAMTREPMQEGEDLEDVVYRIVKNTETQRTVETEGTMLAQQSEKMQEWSTKLSAKEGFGTTNIAYLEETGNGKLTGVFGIQYKGEDVAFQMEFDGENYSFEYAGSTYTCTPDKVPGSIKESLETAEAAKKAQEQLISDIESALPEGFTASLEGTSSMRIYNAERKTALKISADGDLQDVTTISLEHALNNVQRIQTVPVGDEGLAATIGQYAKRITNEQLTSNEGLQTVYDDLSNTASTLGNNGMDVTSIIASESESNSGFMGTANITSGENTYSLLIKYSASGKAMFIKLGGEPVLFNAGDTPASAINQHIHNSEVKNEETENLEEKRQEFNTVMAKLANIPNTRIATVDNAITISVPEGGGRITYTQNETGRWTASETSVYIDGTAETNDRELSAADGEDIADIIEQDARTNLRIEEKEEEKKDALSSELLDNLANSLSLNDGLTITYTQEAPRVGLTPFIVRVQDATGSDVLVFQLMEDRGGMLSYIEVKGTDSDRFGHLEGSLQNTKADITTFLQNRLINSELSKPTENNEQEQQKEFNSVVESIQSTDGYNITINNKQITVRLDSNPDIYMRFTQLGCGEWFYPDSRAGIPEDRYTLGGYGIGSYFDVLIIGSSEEIAAQIMSRMPVSTPPRERDRDRRRRNRPPENNETLPNNEFGDVAKALLSLQSKDVSVDVNIADKKILLTKGALKLQYVQTSEGDWQYIFNEVNLATGSDKNGASSIVTILNGNNPEEVIKDDAIDQLDITKVPKPKNKPPENKNQPPVNPPENNEISSEYPNLDKDMVDAIRKRNRGEPYAEHILKMINEPPPMSKSDQKLVLNIIKNYSPEEQKVWAGLQEKCIALGKQLSPEDLKLYTGAFSKRNPSLLQQISPEGRRAIALAESGFTTEEVALLKKMNQQYLDKNPGASDPEDLGSGGALLGPPEKEGGKEDRESDEDSPEKEKRFSKVLDDLKKEDFDVDAVRTKYQGKIDDIQAKIDADPPPKKAKLKKLRKLKQKWNKKLKTLGKLEKKMKPLLQILSKVDNKLARQIKKLAIQSDGITLQKEKGGDASRKVMKALFKKGKIDEMQGETLSFKKFAKLILKRNPDISIDEDTDSIDSDDDSAPDSGEKLTGIERRLIALNNTQEWLQSKGMLSRVIESDNHINIANNIVTALESSAAKNKLGIYVDGDSLYLEDGYLSDTEVHNSFVGILKTRPMSVVESLRSKIGESGYSKIDSSLRELADALDVPA